MAVKQTLTNSVMEPEKVQQEAKFSCVVLFYPSLLTGKAQV